MNESKTEVRLQFKSQAGFFGEHAEGFRNEFIIQLKPTNSMYMKMNIKKPGLEMDAITAELNLSYDDRCILHAISLPGMHAPTATVSHCIGNCIAVMLAQSTPCSLTRPIRPVLK